MSRTLLSIIVVFLFLVGLLFISNEGEMRNQMVESGEYIQEEIANAAAVVEESAEALEEKAKSIADAAKTSVASSDDDAVTVVAKKLETQEVKEEILEEELEESAVEDVVEKREEDTEENAEEVIAEVQEEETKEDTVVRARISEEEIVEEAKKKEEMAEETAGRSSIVDDKAKILFAYGSGDLTPSAFRTLSTVARKLHENPTLTAKIVGNADSLGDKALNEVLSIQRARIVSARLKALGVRPSQIELAALSSTNPIGPNNTRQGRQQNRRVDISLER